MRKKEREREGENCRPSRVLLFAAGEGGRDASGGRRSRRIDVRGSGQAKHSSIGRINDLINKAFLRRFLRRAQEKRVGESGGSCCRIPGKKNRQFVECTDRNSARKNAHLHFICAIDPIGGREEHVGSNVKYESGIRLFFWAGICELVACVNQAGN